MQDFHLINQMTSPIDVCREHVRAFFKALLPPFNLQLGAYMAELRDEDTQRAFVMSMQGNKWIPIRQDGVRPAADTVVLQQSGRHQTLHMVRFTLCLLLMLEI